MTRLIVSTNTREVAAHMPSGYLYTVDLEKLQVLRETAGIEPPYRESDHNPRGGMRGLRGISIHNGELAVAIYSAILVFDCHWNLRRSITHPSVSSIHEILYTDTGIWTTSTANDLLVRFDLNGDLREFDSMRSHRDLMSQLGCNFQNLLRDADIQNGTQDFRNRTYFKTDVFDRTHLNGITLASDGTLFLSLGLIVGDSFGVLFDVKTLMLRLGIWDIFLSINRGVRKLLGLKKQRLSELVVQPLLGNSAIISGHPQTGWRKRLQFRATQNPSHSLRFLNDGTGVYLATSQGSLVHFDMQGNILSRTVLSEKFLRGMLVLPNGQLAIGAGNVLLIHDLERKKTVAELELSTNEKNTVFDIQTLPEDFELPPNALQSKLGRIIGFDGSKLVWDKPS